MGYFFLIKEILYFFKIGIFSCHLLFCGASRETWVVKLVDVVLLIDWLAELDDALEGIKQAGVQSEPNQSRVRVSKKQSHLQLTGLPAGVVRNRILCQELQQGRQVLCVNVR